MMAVMIASVLRSAHAQSLARRTIRIVVPFNAGGIADLTARIVAPALAEQLDATVLIENKPGAGGVVAGQHVARAPADGLTLLLMTNATAVSSALFKQLPFDPHKDFAPISLIGSFGFAIVVNADAPAASFGQWLEQARVQALHLGTINVGSTQHLAGELLKTSAGLRTEIVPFNGSPAVLSALRGKHIDAVLEAAGTVAAQVRAGALRALAVTGDRRSALLPDVPTATEAGLAGFQVSSWNALAAPAATAPALIEQLNQALRRALAREDVLRRLHDLDLHARPGTPGELAALLADDARRWAAVIRAAGIDKQ